MAEVHQHPFSQAERQIYIESLIAGVTGRSKKVILMEMDHILREVYDEDKKEFASLLSMIEKEIKNYIQVCYVVEIFRKNSQSTAGVCIILMLPIWKAFTGM